MTLDDTIKRSLTIFWELFIAILCAPKHLIRYYHSYLKTFGSQIQTEGSLKIEEATL